MTDSIREFAIGVTCKFLVLQIRCICWLRAGAVSTEKLMLRLSRGRSAKQMAKMEYERATRIANGG